MEPNKPEENQQEEPQNTAQPQAETNPYQTSEASQVEESVVSEKERQYAMFCHLGALTGLIGIPFAGIIVPLVLWLIKKDESEYINYHGKESLNFNITVFFAVLVFAFLSIILIGIPFLIITFIAWLVLAIIAGVKANDGLRYRYPFTIRLIS